MHPVHDFNFAIIAKSYLKTSFIINIIACLPLLVYESLDLFYSSTATTDSYIEDKVYWYISLLSLLRIFMFYKVNTSIIGAIDFFTRKFHTLDIIKISNCIKILLYSG